MGLAEDLERARGPKRSKALGEEWKCLVIDIETRPALALVWDLFNQNVSLGQLQEAKSTICFAAKWLHSPKKDIMFYSTWDDGFEEMVQAAWDLLNEANAVITYNGDKFDLKILTRHFIEVGLPPTSPTDSIDIYKGLKRVSSWTSHKLDHIAQELGVGAKHPHTGFDLWLGCLKGDPKCHKVMEKYNKQDVIVTEDLFHRVRNHLPNMPSLSVHVGEVEGCPQCTSTRMEKVPEKYRTKTRVYDMFRCKDCGVYSRGSKMLPDTAVRRTVVR